MSITYRLGTPEDNPKIQELVSKVTMPGPATFCFQRHPDFFVGSHVIGTEFVLVVAIDHERDDAMAGLTVISGRDVFISGKVRKVYYSGDTRVDPFYRRRGIATEMFQVQKQHRLPEDLMQGLVVKENVAPIKAGRTADKGVFFNDWFSHTIETSFMFSRKGAPRVPAGIEIRRATEADVPAMQAFNDREAPRRHGYPVYSYAKLLAKDPFYAGLSIGDFALAFKNGQMVGLMAAWNQKSYKQTRIMGFKPIIAAVRPLYNLYAKLFGGFNLPPVGGMLNYLSLYNILIANDDTALFQGMIDWVMVNQGKGFDAVATCMAQGDPLDGVPRTYKRQKMFTSHFWLSYGDDPRPGIDERPLYMELGRL
jgi:GNAT superfamily N-acetyltransferase